MVKPFVFFLSETIYNFIILDIIHRTALHLKHNVSETEFCLRLWEGPDERRQRLALSVVPI
jgi:hypothetical protein